MQSRADQVCRAMRYKGDFLSLCKMQLQSSGLKWQKEWSLTRHGESPSFSAFWRQAERIRVCVSLPEEPVFFPNWCWVLAPSVFNFTGNISLQMTIIHAITLRQFTQLHITFITMFFFFCQLWTKNCFVWHHEQLRIWSDSSALKWFTFKCAASVLRRRTFTPGKEKWVEEMASMDDENKKYWWQMV